MGRARALAVLCAVIAAWPLGSAQAQQNDPVGIVDNPCPPPLPRPPEMAATAPGARPNAAASPAVAAYLQEQARRRAADRGGMCRYRADDEAFLAAHNRAPTAVFIGDSITDFWPGLDGTFFTGANFVGRGIGAQVSAQGLMRFEQDVIALHPRVVHILYGVNDIAGLGGPTSLQNIRNNLTAMVQLARANHIAVVIGTILPITHLPNGVRVPAIDPNIVAMNQWLRDYGKREHIPIADYYPALSDGAGGFKADLNSDGVHPTLAGYRVMEPLTRAAIQAALSGR
jgi:lysophospholipase L1-like esterase